MGFEGNGLVVKFDPAHKFHSGKVALDENRRLIESVLQEMIGPQVLLNVYAEATEGAFQAQYDLVEEAKNVFGDAVVVLEE